MDTGVVVALGLTSASLILAVVVYVIKSSQWTARVTANLEALSKSQDRMDRELISLRREHQEELRLLRQMQQKVSDRVAWLEGRHG